METTTTDNSNSLETLESKTQIIPPSEITPSGYKKKDFVFTEKRKENLIKANKARKEKEDFKKQLRDKYEAATVELQKLYESKINSFKNSTENQEEDTEMSNSKRVKAASEIPIQPIIKEPVLSQKDISSDSSSDSEVSEKHVQKKRKKPKTNSKKPKKIIYVSESESSEEEIIVKKKKPKKHVQIYSESDSEPEPIQHSSKHYRSMPPPQAMNYPPNRKIGAISGCVF